MSVLVGKQAPDFTVPAVLGDGQIVDSFSFSEATSGKYAVVFFYPLDFTFVCPSELIALDHRMAEFKSRGVEVIAVSIDSHFTHNAWRNTPVNKGGIGPVRYTMAADIGHSICKDYDVDALQFFEENGEVCPAGWNKGDSGMNASPAGVAEYLDKNADKL
jgi:peroxiredoxin (alkyl hydroperoxide reductase subunit C)